MATDRERERDSIRFDAFNGFPPLPGRVNPCTQWKGRVNPLSSQAGVLDGRGLRGFAAPLLVFRTQNLLARARDLAALLPTLWFSMSRPGGLWREEHTK